MDTVQWRKAETKIQKQWTQKRVFEAEPNPKKKKFFINFPIPYVNGLLHLGHAFSSTRCDVFARFKRMQGFNVLYAQGWHATGTPIVAAAKRIAQGEPTQVESLEKMGFSSAEIRKFSDPTHWIQTFVPLAKRDFQAIGASLDWRRSFVTTDLNPAFDQFIRWQFEKLRQKGFIVKGKHPVVWCPRDQMPVGDHDRQTGEGEVPQEFVLLKFKFNDLYLIAATLRPETMYGQTNLWVNPEIEYVIIQVGNEKWVVSSECAEKLTLQKEKITQIGTIPGRELIGKKALAPGIQKEVIILSASFCDPAVGSGIVTSVPSDAPFDYIALKELQNNSTQLAKYNLNPEEIKSIKPIPIIVSKNNDQLPAVTIVEKFKITDQNDPRLEELTREIYKEGFYHGVMNQTAGKLAGKPVEWAKDEIQNELVQSGQADLFFELRGNVVCRCLTPCTVKIVSDQWFITYGNKEWKKQAQAALLRMKLFPESSRAQFEHTIEWLRDWACAREHGTGTRLPWDNKWIIESLSDSTIYMAYYPLAKYLQNPKKFKISIAKLNNDFFDFVLFGEGNPKAISKTTGVAEKTLRQIRSEFDYWYGFDFRGSGKDLIQNHLCFLLFNHTAIFPQKYWPRTFGVNGWLLINGEKMSKSKGNFFTIFDILNRFPADVIRAALMAGGEGLNDPNFELSAAENWQRKLQSWEQFATQKRSAKAGKPNSVDAWFESVVTKSLQETTAAFEETKFRTALERGFFDLQRHLKWYLRRKKNPNPKTLDWFVDVQTRILTPFTPHLCEMIWKTHKKNGFIVQSTWPTVDSKRINETAEQNEQMIVQTLQDVQNLLQFLARKQKPKPSKLFLYTIPKELANYISAKEFLEIELNVQVHVFANNDPTKFDPQNKAVRAAPGKPGVYLE